MTFDLHERAMLAGLADELIPAGDGFPSASQAGVAASGLDQVLAVRPDLGEGLKRVVSAARDRRPAEFLDELRRTDPAGFGILSELVPAAYFLDRDVRAKLGYEGQTPKPIDPRPDYLEEGLLQSVLDRGPIYRPTPGQLPCYDWRQTYDWNYEHAPQVVPQDEPAVPGRWDFCGLPVGSPLGVAAGPLLNGHWIRYYAALGFDVLTYKTVRSRQRACYPLPNLQPVISPIARASSSSPPLGAEERVPEGRERGHLSVSPALKATTEMHGSWAVSFGMPSRPPDIWRADVEATRRALPGNKLLSVSVVATPEAHWALEEIAEDFARCARWAVESGADSVEANFSCPNVGSADAQLYQQPEAASVVAAQLRKAIGAKPLLIKIGHVTDERLATDLSRAVAPHATALVMVNCITAKVVDAQGRLLFDGNARGIAGESIRQPAVDQIRLFAGVLRRHALNLKLVGVGGIATADHVQAHLDAGAHAVQLATAAMLDPSIGIRIRSEFYECRPAT